MSLLMQMKILFTNPYNAMHCWKVVSIKSNYCDKKYVSLGKQKTKLPVVCVRPCGF